MARRLFVEEKECIGCGLCAEIAPGVFRLNAEGIAEVINPEENNEKNIQEVLDECPVECIHWEDG